MLDEIKSAREIAQEKIARLGQVTEEESLRWRYVPEGEMLAAKYLNKGQDITGQLSRYQGMARQYVLKGAGEVLLSNIGLPRNDAAKNKNEKAIDTLIEFKKDKTSALNVIKQMRTVFSHYQEQGEQQRKQAYENLKIQFKARLEQAIEQQMGSTSGLDISVDSLPQFREEWQRMLAQLDTQYINHLDEYKHQLRAIS
jgi:hypothetical protein